MAAKAKKGTRRSDYIKRRKGVLSVAVPWFRRFGLALILVLGLLWTGAWLHFSGTMGRTSDWIENKFLLATADAGFAVKNIMVEGRQYTDANVLLAMINIQKGDPLFSFNPQEAQDLIRQIGWVESVQIERRWPDTIYVGLKEREPLALWRTENTIKLVDVNGKVIVTDNLQRFADLLIIDGPGAPENAPMLIKTLMAESDIFARVESAQWVGGRRWDLRLKNGMSIKLPEEDIGLGLSRLAGAQQEEAIMDKDIVAIDLREMDRISIQTKPGQAQAYQDSLKIEAATQETSGNNI